MRLISYLINKYLLVRPRYEILRTLNIMMSPSPNFSQSNDRKIRCIVLHGTASSTTESTLRHFADRLTGVSAHYVVGKDGGIHQCVNLDKIAWHAVKSSWRGYDGVNKFSLGIELVNREDGKDDYPFCQVNACLTLCFALCIMYGLDTDSVTTHKAIASGR